jgi:hypothetical protein
MTSAARVRDPVYLHRVHLVGCWAQASIPGHVCSGGMEADHAGRRPLGRKCDDSECVALCRGAHCARTDWSGEFRSWAREQMRQWLVDGIRWTRACVDGLEAV